MEPRPASVWLSAFFALIGISLWLVYLNSKWLFYCPPPLACNTSGSLALTMIGVAVTLVAVFTRKEVDIERPGKVCLVVIVILTYAGMLLIFAHAELSTPLVALDILITGIIVAILTFAVAYVLLTLLPKSYARGFGS